MLLRVGSVGMVNSATAIRSPFGLRPRDLPNADRSDESISPVMLLMG